MCRFMLLLATACILVTQGAAEPADSGPWTVSGISKSDSHRHAKARTGDSAGPLKYLHLGVKFDPNNPDRKLSKFRVVDSEGKTVGDMFGADPKRSLLVFEREIPWVSLNGLYLEGQGIRVPLFATEPVRPAPTTVVQPTPVLAPTMVEQPRTVYVPPRTDNVVTVPATPTYVPRTETVKEPRDRIVVHHGRVIHDGPDEVVHDDPDVVVSHDDDTTWHVGRHHPDGRNSGSGRRGTASGSEIGPASAPRPGLDAVEDSKPGMDQSDGPLPGITPDPAKAPTESMFTEQIPDENPMNMNKANVPKTGGRDGGPDGIGPTNPLGSDYRNLPGPDSRFHNLAPDADLPEVDHPLLDVYGYRPTIPYFDPRFRFDPRIVQPEYSHGDEGDRGDRGGYDTRTDYDALARTGFPEMPELPKMMGEIVLYISAGDDGEEGGKIYQVNDAGRVLGEVKLSYQATGLALHRNDGLIAVTPRDRGKIYRVDDKGILSVIMENNPKLPYPVDVGVAGDSDMIVVADSVADVLMGTNIVGIDPVICKRFKKAQYDQQNMSVAVTRDEQHVMYGTDAQNGIYRFNLGKKTQETESQRPILPRSGGVAADPKSLKWAATQSPNEIHVYEGGVHLKTFKLAPAKSIYGQGLLSFAPSGAVVVATRHSDEVDKEVWLTAYETAEGKEGQIISLFPWNRERMLDFVVGPRMIWESHSPTTNESEH